MPWGEIVAAYDDRNDVIAMYKKYHINAHLRSIHDVCAYTQPKKEAQ